MKDRTTKDRTTKDRDDEGPDDERPYDEGTEAQRVEFHRLLDLASDIYLSEIGAENVTQTDEGLKFSFRIRCPSQTGSFELQSTDRGNSASPRSWEGHRNGMPCWPVGRVA